MSTERLLVPQELLAKLGAELDAAQPDEPVKITVRNLRAILRHIEILQDTILATEGEFCEVCGCTQNHACDGGCSWVAEGLCSSCRFQVEPADDGAEDGSDGWQVLDLLEGVVLGDEKGSIIYRCREDAERVALAGVVDRMDIDEWDGPEEDEDLDDGEPDYSLSDEEVFLADEDGGMS